MKKWFTLIELIVVITILAILWTIAFISFKGFTTNARDSVRLNDSSNINKWLSLVYSTEGFYPVPDNYAKVLDKKGIFMKQWEMWNQAQSFINMKDAQDPLTKGYYDYSVKENWKLYTLWVNYEWDVALDITTNAKAEWENETTLVLSGTDAWLIVEKSTWKTPEWTADIDLTNSDATYDFLVWEETVEPSQFAYWTFKSCKEIHDLDPAAPTWKYKITPKIQTFTVYCEMDLQGWGWTYWQGWRIDENTQDSEFSAYWHNETIPDRFNEIYRLPNKYMEDIDFTESYTKMSGETADYTARYEYPNTMNAIIPYKDLWGYLGSQTFKWYHTYVAKQDFTFKNWRVIKAGESIPYPAEGQTCKSSSDVAPWHFRCWEKNWENSQNPWYQAWRVNNLESTYYSTFDPENKSYGRWKTENQESPVVNDGWFDKTKLGRWVHTCIRISDENWEYIHGSCREDAFTQWLYSKPGCNNSNASWMNFITWSQCDYRQDTSVYYEWRDYVR